VRHWIALLSFSGLFACGLPQVDPLDIPTDVAQFIPADIDQSEVNRDPDGCYFYTYAGNLFTVEDDNGDPVCVPDAVASRGPSWDWQLTDPYDLKRDVEVMDFVVTEGCYDDGWCDDVLTYAAVGKPIYAAEYTDTRVDFAAACAYGDANDVSFILKDRDLSAALQTCP